MRDPCGKKYRQHALADIRLILRRASVERTTIRESCAGSRPGYSCYRFESVALHKQIVDPWGRLDFALHMGYNKYQGTNNSLQYLRLNNEVILLDGLGCKSLTVSSTVFR